MQFHGFERAPVLPVTEISTSDRLASPLLLNEPVRDVLFQPANLSEFSD